MIEKIQVANMRCIGCDELIEQGIKPLAGVIQVKADYQTNSVTIEFNEKIITLKQLNEKLGQLGYPVATNKQPNNIVVVTLLVIGLVLLWEFSGLAGLTNYFPTATTSMSLVTLFVIGLLTSVHCVAMCGGICLSVTLPASTMVKTKFYRASFLYNLGRIISYTILGAIIGAVGAVLSPSPIFKGIIMLLAGLFMIVMALNMLNLIPGLKRLNIQMPKFLRKRLMGNSRSPFYIGLLNGFMPCGPLQAMQLYALSTGSFWLGGLSMMVFGLGTAPLMFGLGAISSFLSKSNTQRLMTFSAVLVLVLGLGMLGNGLSLSGINTPSLNFGQPKTEIVIENGVQLVESTITANSYEPIVVKQGIPVRWNIKVKAEDLNSCNNAIIIPEYGITIELQPGDNIIEFVPKSKGVIPFTCWMGMIKSQITIIE